MSPTSSVIYDIGMVILGFCLGWVVCWEINRRQLAECWDEYELVRDEMDEVEGLLRNVCLAATPVVHRMRAAIESDDCEEGDEMWVSRSFEWREIEPLAKAINEVREVYDEGI